MSGSEPGGRCGARASVSPVHAQATSLECRGCSFAEFRRVYVTNKGAKSTLCLSYALPNRFRSGEKPGWCKRRSIWFTAKLPERDTDKFCHSSSALAQELVIIHSFPPEWKGMLSAHPAPLVVIHSELLA